jgi:hypothetical protein
VFLDNTGTTDITLLFRYDHSLITIDANWTDKDAVFCKAGKVEKVVIEYAPVVQGQVETVLEIVMNGEVFFSTTIRALAGSLGYTL